MENLHLLINKTERLLQVLDGAEVIRSYEIAVGSEPVGNKEVEGDAKTPEGEFYIFTKNPQSNFFLSLAISYPDSAAAQRGLRENLISVEESQAIIKANAERKIPPQKTKLGGEIYIHGGGNFKPTKGCIALINEEMRELYDLIPVGAAVKIVP